MSKAIYASLQAVQRELKSPKDKDGDKNKYKYRSAEDILENAKPLLHANGLIITLDDDLCVDGIGSYIKATATVTDVATGDSLQTHAVAREDVGTRFMSPGQASGSCSSFARKYALCGLLAIDDSRDMDSPEYQEERRNAQNNAQAKKKEVEGKPIATNPKSKSGQNDAVRAQAMNRLNAVIKGKGLGRPFLVANAEKIIGKKATEDMTAEEIIKLAEALEAEK